MPPASVAPASSTPLATAETSPVPVASLLPGELDGVELHTFAVGQDSTERLLAVLGAESSDLEIAYASEHGARFLQMYAMRVLDIDGSTLLDAFVEAAYDPADGAVARSDEEIAGKPVTVIQQSATAERLGTFYAYAFGDVLLVAQAFDRQTAQAGLAALP